MATLVPTKVCAVGWGEEKVPVFKASGMEMVEPLIEDTVLLYFVGIDCVIGNGEYGRSDSLTGRTVDANKLLGNAFVYAITLEKGVRFCI